MKHGSITDKKKSRGELPSSFSYYHSSSVLDPCFIRVSSVFHPYFIRGSNPLCLLLSISLLSTYLNVFPQTLESERNSPTTQ